MHRTAKWSEVFLKLYLKQLWDKTVMKHMHFSITHIAQASEMQPPILLRNISSFQVLACWPKETLQAATLSGL